MDTLITRIVLGIIIAVLGTILAYILRQDKQLKRPIILDIESLPKQPDVVVDSSPEKSNTKPGKSNQKSARKKH